MRNLALLTTKEKVTYVLARAKGVLEDKVNRLTTMIIKMIKKRVCKVYVTLGCPLPFSLRSFYILGIYYQARRKYVPQSYPGRAIYIKSEKRNSEHQVNWRKLMAGGLEVHEVPGDHMTIISQPNVHVWAEKLKARLDRAAEKAGLYQNVKL